MPGSKERTLNASLRIFGNDVGRLAGMDRADGDDRRLGRVDVARDDRLQRHDEVARHDDGIDRQVRARGMAAFALDGNLDRVRRRHHRAGAHQEGAFRSAGMVVKAEDRVERETLEQAVGDHRLRAAVLAGLFRRLEDQMSPCR